MASTALVEFHDVTKRFGNGPLVLDRVSLQAERGDFISIVGPSGCGKSTLLRLIAGLSPLSGGSLQIEGQTPEAASAELAFVFQDATLLPWLTVAKNVQVPLKLRRMPRSQRETACERVLGLVGLREKHDAYPRQLSGGQKMRVSIARALALSPKLLLLDEPFAALDQMTRERLNEELLAIRAAQAWTAFFVTHSVAEAVFLSNRVIVLAPNPGRIAANIVVDFPYPRTADTRVSRRYLEQVAEISQTLRAAETTAAPA